VPAGHELGALCTAAFVCAGCVGRSCFAALGPPCPEKGCAALDVAAGLPSGRGLVVVVVAEVTGVEERELVVVKERFDGIPALRRASRWRQRLQIMAASIYWDGNLRALASRTQALDFEMRMKLRASGVRT